MSVNKSRIVVWCTELASVRAINDALGKGFELIFVNDAPSLNNRSADPAPLAAVIDHAAAQDAIGLLQSLKQTHPKIRRILVTDYCDLGIIVQGLHTEAVQKIVYKPIHGPELLTAIGAQTAGAMVPIQGTHHVSTKRAVG
jgi:response regulator RpfG family c-di-GMP phosphodiesterase